MTAPYRFMGLDLSLIQPGYGWLDLNGLGCQSIKSRGDEEDQHRIYSIRAEVAALRREVRPHLVVIESVFIGINPQGAMRLYGLQEVICQDLWINHIPYVRVNGMHRCIYGTGKARQPKDVVLGDVRAAYGHLVGGPASIHNDDEADALVLVAMAADHYGQPLIPLPESHRRALKAVPWPATLAGIHIPERTPK